MDEEFEAADAKANIPLSEVDPQTIHDFIDLKKTFLSTVEGDLKDGKRRVTAAKGPKGPRTRANGVQQDDDDDESGSDGLEDDE